MNPRLLRVLIAIAAAGCAPGHIEWTGGDDLLRSAFFAAPADDAAIRFVVVTTAAVECDTSILAPSEPLDPDDVATYWAELATGICREDARHLFLTLGAPQGETTWEGRYDGRSTSSDEPLDGPTRFTYASFLAVEEAEVDADDGIALGYEATRAVRLPDMGDGGFVEVLRYSDTELRGTFGFPHPDVRVSGRFSAEPCPELLTVWTSFDASAFECGAFGTSP